MKIGISQSNYIPWIGYFDYISKVQKFIIIDNVQYTKNDWRNRNLISLNGRKHWLTIPITKPNGLSTTINKAIVSNPNWYLDHLDLIRFAYKKSPYYKELFPMFEELYLSCKGITHLSKINHLFITHFCNYLGIQTRIDINESADCGIEKNQRLIDLCISNHAKEYVALPASRNYLHESKFLEHKIKVNWFEYKNYDSTLLPSDEKTRLSALHYFFYEGFKKDF